MNCDTAATLLHAYADGELERSVRPELEAHVRECGGCAAYLERLRSLQNEIRENLPYPIPDGLERRVRASLEAAAVFREPRRTRSRAWLLALAPAAALGCFLLLWVPHPAGNAVASDVVSGHIRSLMQSHLVDVPSSDQHTVKPWFNGKLDFSPAVKDLGTSGFRLIGGRLDYLGSRPVAAVVYGRRQHIINVFAWPDTRRSAPPRVSSQNGYNVIHWTAGGLAYWAVSDLNSKELGDFVRLLQ